MRAITHIFLLVLIVGLPAQGADNPLFEYLEGNARLIAYTPSQLDPRNPANNAALRTSSLRDDLSALRTAFDGLILYGYHEACTPRILSLAVELKYRGVLLAIWDPKSAAEIDGVGQLAEQFQERLVMGIIVGNEGLTFGRYEFDDLRFASARLRSRLNNSIPLTTSEPLVGYQRDDVLQFGDFLCPNIHPVFDHTDADAPSAAAWARARALELTTKTNKVVLVKETGFPHAGNPKYTPQSQAEFWQSYTGNGLKESASGGTAFFCVAFEAFDLPWKSEASGLEIEKSWGLMSTSREPHPAFEIWKQLGSK